MGVLSFASGAPSRASVCAFTPKRFWKALVLGSANATHSALQIKYEVAARVEGPGSCAYFSAMFAAPWPFATPVEKHLVLKGQGSGR